MNTFESMPHNKHESAPSLRRYAEELIALAHENINDLYRRETEDPLERREYHNIEHTKGAEEKTERILRVMLKKKKEDSSIGVTERDIILGRLIAAYHDIDQSQSAPREVSEMIGKDEFTKTLRLRNTERIEKNSAGILLGRMHEINERHKKIIFTEEDMRIAREAILATIPGFDRNLGTITQPFLHEDASLVTHAVALADLGAMMDGGKEFLNDGNRVFREDNIDVARALEDPKHITEKEKEFIYTRIKNWYEMQIKFIEGRKEIFELQILSFPESVRDEVKELFKFDEAIEAAKKRFAEIEQAEHEGKKHSFEEIVKSMGYRKELKRHR